MWDSQVPRGAELEHGCHQPPSSPSSISQVISVGNDAGWRALQSEIPPQQEGDPDPQLEAASTTAAEGGALPSCSLVMPGGLPDKSTGLGITFTFPKCCLRSPAPLLQDELGLRVWHHPDRDGTEMTAGSVLGCPGAGAPHQPSPLTLTCFILPSPCSRAGAAPPLLCPLGSTG